MKICPFCKQELLQSVREHSDGVVNGSGGQEAVFWCVRCQSYVYEEDLYGFFEGSSDYLLGGDDPDSSEE